MTNQPDRIQRNIICGGSCEGKPKTYISTIDQSEICSECLEVLSYIKANQKVLAPKEPKQKVNKKKAEAPKKTEGIIAKPKVIIKDSSFIGNHNEKEPIERNKVYCGGWEEIMPRIPDKFVDYIFTSPPYNIEGSTVSGQKYSEEETGFDAKTQQEYLDWQIELITQSLRITKNHIFYNNQLLANNKVALLSLMEHFKYNLKEVMIWDKSVKVPPMTKHVLAAEWELILIFSNIEPLDRNFKDARWVERGEILGNICRIKQTQTTNKKNKAAFAVNFPRYFMRNFGKQGDLWYDMHGGTGTTAISAILEEKDWLISEKLPEMINDITNRIQAHSNQTKLEFA